MVHIDDSVKLKFLMNETELAAIDHKIPMTQELFESIIDKLFGMKMDDFFDHFINENMEFLCAYADKEKRMQKILDPEIHLEEELSRIDERWAGLCKRIEAFYGEDAIEDF